MVAAGKDGFRGSGSAHAVNQQDTSALAADIAQAVEGKSARQIAAALRRLITAGDIEQGAKLPTVRELSVVLGVSPATVNQAWQGLVQAGVLTTRGRAGTFVTAALEQEVAQRFLGLGGPSIPSTVDLSRGTPDPLLLPSLASALARVTTNGDIWSSSYFDEPVIAELDGLLRETWPFRPESVTVVDGALDALTRIVDQLITFGDRVVVESPGFPPLLDILERAGAEIISIPLDEQGLSLPDLQNSMYREPVAIFVQPRAHNPTGTSMSQLRASEIAACLSLADCWVIEDDHSGDISGAPDVSIGQYLPHRTVHIRSYSKTHGPDLRLAAVGGAAEVIDPLVRQRMLGPGWSSRLLQHILVELLTDPDSMSTVERARDEYSFRSTHLREALADRGLESSPGDGINVFIPVTDEQSTLVNLAAQGIRVAPGKPFFTGRDSVAGVRVTVAGLPSDPRRITELADTLVQAIGTATPARGLR